MRLSILYFMTALVFTLSPGIAIASDSSVFVSQINKNDTPEQGKERQFATFSTPGTGHLGAIDIDRIALSRTSESNNHDSISVASQKGRGNRLAVIAVGSGNVTLQQQRGVGNSSDIALAGRRNAVAVDQRGNYLDSDVQIIGSNKVIFHFQRGAGKGNSQPLLYTGNQRETQLILDTPKGRLTKSVAN